MRQGPGPGGYDASHGEAGTEARAVHPVSTPPRRGAVSLVHVPVHMEAQDAEPGGIMRGMSRRPGLIVTHRIKAEGRWPLTKSPNVQPDVITAEVRCHWPYLAPKEAVIEALRAAHAKAVEEVEGEWSSSS